jgi:cytochrome c-type biogenesis protein CcmH
MTRWRLAAAFLALGLAQSGAALAVEPDEMLADPALEARARTLSAELRCMVCQNQSIDDSDAELARDLRVLVRERLAAGDSDEAVLAYVVSRYGEFVLLKPRLSLRNALLWGTPAALLLVGGTVLVLAARRRAQGGAEEPLSAGERERLAKALEDGGGS